MATAQRANKPQLPRVTVRSLGAAERAPEERSEVAAEVAQQAWRALLDDRGATAMDKGKRLGLTLDTIAYAAPDDFTLYLPSW